MWTVVDNGKEREATDLESFAVAMTYVGSAIQAASDPHTARLIASGAYERFLNSDEDGCCTLEAVAGLLGVGREYARQIEARALAKLRAAWTGQPYVDPRPDRLRSDRCRKQGWTVFRHERMVRRMERVKSALADNPDGLTVTRLCALCPDVSRQMIRMYLLDMEGSGTVSRRSSPGRAWEDVWTIRRAA